MALSDEIPGAGTITAGFGVAADLVFNSGEIVLSLVTLVISSPDVWLTIVTGARRIASIAGVSTAWLDQLIVAVTVLMMLISLRKLIGRWRSDG